MVDEEDKPPPPPPPPRPRPPLAPTMPPPSHPSSAAGSGGGSQLSKEQLLMKMEAVDRDIAATESQITSLQKRQTELEEGAAVQSTPSPLQPSLSSSTSSSSSTAEVRSEDGVEEEGVASFSVVGQRQGSPKRSLQESVYSENKVRGDEGRGEGYLWLECQLFGYRSKSSTHTHTHTHTHTAEGAVCSCLTESSLLLLLHLSSCSTGEPAMLSASSSHVSLCTHSPSPVATVQSAMGSPWLLRCNYKVSRSLPLRPCHMVIT